MNIKPGMITDWDLMEEQVQFYRDHLDIFIEDQYAPIKFTNTQRIIAREFGLSHDVKVVCSRGYGKTFVMGVCCFAMCCLYPGTIVRICSGTAAQAALTLGKIKALVDRNKNMQAELKLDGSRTLVTLSKDHGKCTFKNGSMIESHTLDSMRGLRATIIIVDEALEVEINTLNGIVAPILNYKRDIAREYGFKDYPTKMIAITSACEKNNSFYSEFKRVAGDMGKGMPGSFACALDYNAAIDDGLTEAAFFEKEKARMPASVFQMEYGSIFPGATENSAFPYELVEGCRTLQKVELEQPKNSKSRYVISIDIATSEAATADNSIISVIKFTERNDGTFSKKLVNMRSFHGRGLDVLAQEVRKIYHLKFPNAERIIYDKRGVGDAFDRFFDEPWIDPASGKEYPPLVLDDAGNVVENAEPKLHAISAVQQLNQRIATNLRVMLEKHTIELPANSRIVQAKRDEENTKPLTMEELSIYLEADALQFEMGNIVCKVSTAGNYIYDTPGKNMHKDRYSSLAYGCDYIAMLEEENVKLHKRGDVCIGITSDF